MCRMNVYGHGPGQYSVEVWQATAVVGGRRSGRQKVVTGGGMRVWQARCGGMAGSGVQPVYERQMKDGSVEGRRAGGMGKPIHVQGRQGGTECVAQVNPKVRCGYGQKPCGVRWGRCREVNTVRCRHGYRRNVYKGSGKRGGNRQWW